jgi:hypothetical protein
MPAYEYDPHRTNYNTYGDPDHIYQITVGGLAHAFTQTAGGCPSCGGSRRIETVKFSELDDQFANAIAGDILFDEQTPLLDTGPDRCLPDDLQRQTGPEN